MRMQRKSRGSELVEVEKDGRRQSESLLWHLKIVLGSWFHCKLIWTANSLKFYLLIARSSIFFININFIFMEFFSAIVEWKPVKWNEMLFTIDKPRFSSNHHRCFLNACKYTRSINSDFTEKFLCVFDLTFCVCFFFSFRLKGLQNIYVNSK